ncbi:siderophore-interacting protein [Nocardioides sp.]|uniref:siderophore-interacting protein n=1 Tax=Nocardioides sp. TaxID=35761 RepID=UPI0026393841|nr:siderophore-interacting protein [Nocardioides sp.]
MALPDRPAKPQHLLTVVSSERVSPHMVRLTFSADTISEFPDDGITDRYLKLIFIDPSLGLTPPYDVRALRAELPADQAPRVRTYSVRAVDRAAGTLAVDFVIHGDEGLAGPWAAAAQPGDVISATGPGGAYGPSAQAPFHLFVGDLSALPAISAALERVRPGTPGLALIEIHDPVDEIDLSGAHSVEVRWLLNTDTADVDFLARAAAEAQWPADAQVFAHGERGAIKAVRAVMREREIPREALSISAYWALGRAEDAFQAEKREPIGKID